MPRPSARDLLDRLARANRVTLAADLAAEAKGIAGRSLLSPADRARLAAVRRRVAELRGLRLLAG